MPSNTGLCPNCYPAWQDKPIIVDNNDRCMACGRHCNNTFGDPTYDLNYKERQHYAVRAKRLLSNYQHLADLNSRAAAFVVSDLKETIAKLDQLENERPSRYGETAPDEVVVEKKKSPEQQGFEDYLKERGITDG